MIEKQIHFIISKIKDIILQENLNAGDKLPAERTLSKNFDVSRRNVRDAISTLERYELVKSIPQSGTRIANIGQTALVGVLDSILDLQPDNFKSLVETRVLLEMKTVKCAAEKVTPQNLAKLEKRFNQYKAKALTGDDTTQEDILFHLAIAKVSGNPTLNALMLQITPKLTAVFVYTRIITNDSSLKKNLTKLSSEELKKAIDFEIGLHEDIFLAIKYQNPEKAVKCMKAHFDAMMEIIE